jgi:hypothetical protein
MSPRRRGRLRGLLPGNRAEELVKLLADMIERGEHRREEEP